MLLALALHTSLLFSATAISFEQWRSLHEKVYAPEEAQLREKAWLQNMGIVARHNKDFEEGRTTYAMTMESPFADLTADEFAVRHLMDPQNCSATHSSSGKLRNKQNATVKSVDWRTKGIMTPVKNQGHCGSCWTFSTSGCLESHLCLAANKDCTHWHGLAEQQLVDCAGDFNNHGCSGGLPSQAYEYIKYSGGLEFEESYPYHANETGTCKSCKCGKVAKVAEVFNITSGDEDDLAHAIETLGPVSIAYQVSPDFRLYSHGVYDSWNSTTNTTMCNNTAMDVNHAVVAVGLGETADGVPFYIVRNSWGTSFGMEGHFWMKRGENLCGVSDCASFPIVPLSHTEKLLSSARRKNLRKGITLKSTF